MARSLKEIKPDNETRVKILLQDSVPEKLPCLYVITKMRAGPPNTQQRFLSNLLVFFAWLPTEGIDLEARLQQDLNLSA